MTRINNQADLEAALLVGGDVEVDSGAVMTLARPVTLSQPNTRLLGGNFATPTGPCVTIAAPGCELQGGRYQGPGGTVYDQTQKLVYALGTKDNPLVGVKVHDCSFNESAADNIWMEWCVDFAVHDNIINNALYSGILVISGNGFSITGNTVDNVPIAPGQVDSYGIALTDSTNLTADRTKHGVISNNKVKLVDHEGIDTHGGSNLTISNNDIVGCALGIALVVGNSTRITPPNLCTVTGNTVDASGCRGTLREAIGLFGISGNPADATIVGNTVAGYSTPFTLVNWNRTKTLVGNNSMPLLDWTPIALAAGWTPNSDFPPEYMVDGNLVFTRGGAIPPAGGIAGLGSAPVVGTLPNAAAWPQKRSFYAMVTGSGTMPGSGVLNAGTTGQLRLDYFPSTATGQWTYWLNGSYVAI